jgi:hypothetical protein
VLKQVGYAICASSNMRQVLESDGTLIQFRRQLFSLLLLDKNLFVSVNFGTQHWV